MKIVEKLVEIRRKKLIEEENAANVNQISEIKTPEGLKKYAAMRREPLTREKSELEGKIEFHQDRWTNKPQKRQGWEGQYWPTYADYLKNDMIKVKRAKKELQNLRELMNKEYFVRTKTQKKTVTKILLKEAEQQHINNLKKINEKIRKNHQKLNESFTHITTEYREIITKEFATENNLFFYFKDIDTFNPSESLQIEENLLVIPYNSSIKDLEKQRIVVDVAYDWSTNSGSAWGTRYAGFYGGIEDGSAFIERIPYGIRSALSAEEWLKPAEVKKAEVEGRKVIRQGDVFLIEMKRKTQINAPSSHKISETEKGIVIEHELHGKLQLEGHRWKAVQRKSMASMGVD